MNLIDFKLKANEMKDEIIKIRRHLHANPEIGLCENNTSEFIKNFLRQNNIEYKIFANTGICGYIYGGIKGEKVIALRSDMDALPIIEENTCEYKSLNYGVMHACGHDCHMSILLSVAKILNKVKDSFAGTVLLVFEPAEETVGGAKIMIEEGIFNDFKPNLMIGLHVDETIQSGKIMIREKEVNAASNPFKLLIRGFGGHGAYPHEYVDPIVIASNVIMTVQAMISREGDTRVPTVITFANIHGGTSSNVIPDKVSIEGIIRTVGNRDLIVKRFKEIVSGIVTVLKGNVDIEVYEGYPSLVNDGFAVNHVIKNANMILGEENVIFQSQPKMGVESFAYFANEVPSAFYFLGTNDGTNKTNYPAHNAKFNIDENAMINAVVLQCTFVIDYLTK
ncbi:MAG: M20 metallopeptidase family protein [Sarcina sp.]